MKITFANPEMPKTGVIVVGILDGLKLLRPGGQVIYITCSVLDIENEKLLEELILAKGTFYKEKTLNLLPTDQNDGFFAAILKKI